MPTFFSIVRHDFFGEYTPFKNKKGSVIWVGVPLLGADGVFPLGSSLRLFVVIVLDGNFMFLFQVGRSMFLSRLLRLFVSSCAHNTT